MLVDKYKDSFFREEKLIYKTAAGDSKRKYSIKVKFKLDKFGGNTKISHRFDLNENENGISYDMIFGRDLLSELNIDERFSNGTIKLEDHLIPIKTSIKIWKNKHPTRKELKATVLRSAELKATKEATDKVLKILDSYYEKANLNKVANNANDLNKQQNRMLLKLLQQYKELVDDSLGKRKTAPVKK